jgi:hypothetical protein
VRAVVALGAADAGATTRPMPRNGTCAVSTWASPSTPLSTSPPSAATRRRNAAMPDPLPGLAVAVAPPPVSFVIVVRSHPSLTANARTGVPGA